MGALAVEGRAGPVARPAQPPLFVVADPARPGGTAVADAPGRRPVAARAPVRTLGDVLGAAWGEVAAGRQAVCPLCTGALRPRWSAGAGAVGGRCGDCGTTLE